MQYKSKGVTMKNIYLVLFLISSLLLTQCYTQYEYLTKVYEFNPEDDLKKVVLTDGTEKEFYFNQFDYKIESDSLLITYNSLREPYGNHFKLVTVTDTLRLKEIHSLTISKYDATSTFWLIALGSAGLIGFILLETGYFTSWNLSD